jgi:hypothetical protein
MKGSVAIAVLAIAFSAGAFLPDTMPSIFAGQALAASENASGNGNSGENTGNGGRSADAGSGDTSSSGGPTSGQGNGGGLLRLLATGSAQPSSTGGTAPAAVATGAPVQLLSLHANGGIGSPVTAYVKEIVATTGQPPGEIHRLLGAGHSYFNSNEQAKANAAYDSRIKRVERYLQANAAAQAALAANGGVPPTLGEYADAVAYLGALDVIADLTSTVEEIAAAQAIVDSFPGLTPASAQVIVAAFEAEATAIAAFEEADNQPYNEERRAVYDALAAEYPL